MRTQARPVFQALGTVAHHATAGGSNASSTLLHYSLLGAAALLLLLLGAGAHHEGPTFTVLSSLMTAEHARLSRGAPLEINQSIRALTVFMLIIKLYYFGRPVTWPLSNEQVCIFLCMCEACPTSRWANNNTHWAHAQKSRLDKHGGYGLTR